MATRKSAHHQVRVQVEVHRQRAERRLGQGDDGHAEREPAGQRGRRAGGPRRRPRSHVPIPTAATIRFENSISACPTAGGTGRPWQPGQSGQPRPEPVEPDERARGDVQPHGERQKGAPSWPTPRAAAGAARSGGDSCPSGTGARAGSALPAGPSRASGASVSERLPCRGAVPTRLNGRARSPPRASPPAGRGRRDVAQRQREAPHALVGLARPHRRERQPQVPGRHARRDVGRARARRPRRARRRGRRPRARWRRPAAAATGSRRRAARPRSRGGRGGGPARRRTRPCGAW